MPSLLVHMLEATLIALAAYLAFRIVTLAKNEYADDSEHSVSINRQTKRVPQKINSTREAQIFAGIQLFEMRRKGFDPLDTSITWLHEGISYFLIGACESIASHHGCASDDKLQIMRFVLSRNLGLNHLRIDQLISQKKSLKGSINQEALEAGSFAAEQWMKEKHTPAEYSLYQQVNNWGFVG